jgi:hypothetical protein
MHTLVVSLFLALLSHGLQAVVLATNFQQPVYGLTQREKCILLCVCDLSFGLA